MITALAGGVGASKLLEGLARVIPSNELSIIANTGDDIELFGLYISPDIDIITYTLAGMVNEATGWGLRDDSFRCLEQLIRYGAANWFNLGDRDLATHIWRTMMLRGGKTLSEVTAHIGQSVGLESRLMPMTDTHVPTTILTDDGPLHFQEYLVKHRARPSVRGIRFENIEACVPAPQVIESIRNSEAIVICPSNPLISIGPILSVPGIRQALIETKALVVGVSPVVGGASLKGPTDRMLIDLGMEVSATQVARLYADFLDVFIIDEVDSRLSPEIAPLGIEVLSTKTVMSGAAEKLALAKFIVDVIGSRGGACPHPA